MKVRLVMLGLLALLVGACKSQGGALGTGSARNNSELDYQVVIRGNEALSEQELFDAIDDNLLDFQRTGFGKAAIDDAAYVIEQRYRDNGFWRATVDYDVDPERKRVALVVEEGARVLLGRIEIRGVESLKPKVIRQIAAAERSEDDWYSEVRVNRAITSIKDRYRSFGFLDVQVEVAELEIVGDTANLALQITEGPAYLLNSVFFSGDLVFDETELAQIIEADLGKPYTPRRTARLLGLVETHHADRGYPDVAIGLSEIERGEEGAVNIALVVRPGTRVRVSQIRFEGADRTRDTFVKARMTIEAGDLYSAEEERESFRALYSTGLFSRIEMHLEGEGEERTLLVSLTEDWGRELFLEPGWGSYDQLRLRGGIRERNFLGTGRIARLEGLLSERTKNAEIGVTNPWFFNTGFTADTSVSYTRRKEPSFEFEDTELDFSLLRYWGRADSVSLSYLYRRSSLLSDDLTQQGLATLSEDIDISSIRVGRLRDTRNQFIVPSAGHRTELTLEWGDEALGSELDFLRGIVSFAGYRELGAKTILAASVRTGLIQPTGSTTEIPLQERFFNGGENTVRSYRESQLGPQDSSGNPIGGETFSVFSLEVRQDLPSRLEGALFFDAGNVTEEVSEYFEFPDFGYAIGVGLRYILPVGPLRLDLGVNPDPKDGDADYTVHFSVGRPF